MSNKKSNAYYFCFLDSVFLNYLPKVLCKNKIFSIVLLLIFISCKKNENSSDKGKVWTFEKIEVSTSNIEFVNSITPDVTTKFNLFDFDYFYNGAGVAAGDFNNDGLPDLFFTANQVDNKLYINNGDLEFEDVTDQSGLNNNKFWSNGVTTVDINQDGWLDIYIAQGGPHTSDQRANLLFVNNGDLTFTEQAAQYGLDDKGISTQAAFFDFDKDGDMDCIVLNESELYGVDPVRFNRLHLEQKKKYYPSFSHLYENVNGSFKDITVDAGMDKPTFGLGIAISDINDDGWPDVYIANDYYIPDQLYINRKNGSFRDRSKKHLGQLSFYGMGVDIADINNDFDNDIFVLDMAAQDHVRSKTLMASMDVASFQLLTEVFDYHQQYMFNTLQLNDGSGRYKNIAHKAGVAKTDWSWSALIEDLDLDGHKDIFVTNGYRRYALDNDFKAKVNEQKQKYKGNVPMDVKQQLYEAMPSESLPNILYLNDRQLHFDDVANQIGLGDPSFSNGAVLVDLDLDGDKDIVVNNIDAPAFLYKNNASDQNNYLKVKFADQQKAHLAKVKIICADNTEQLIEVRRTKGYRSTSTMHALFGLGNNEHVKELEISWLDGSVQLQKNIKANQTIIIKYEGKQNTQNTSKGNSIFKPASPVAYGLDFLHQENAYNDFEKEILLPYKQSTMGPKMASADLNADGLDDLLIGGSIGFPLMIYISSGNGFQQKPNVVFELDKGFEDLDIAVGDLDSDGDLDLYVVSGGNAFSSPEKFQDRVYLNDGKANFSRDENFAPSANASGGVAKFVDFDGDEDLDILVGNRIRPQSYPIAARSVLYENQEGKLVDVTDAIIPALNDPAEIINDLVVTDFNQDSKADIIAVGEWSGIRMFTNDDGRFVNSSATFDEQKGWWYSIKELDFNHDQYPDFIVGNVGQNIKHKASTESPFKVFANDFDQTGTLDIVLSQKYKEQYVPSRGKECSSQQMPFVSDKFESYHDFALASLEDVYGEEQLENAYERQATTFTSILLQSDESGNYTAADLPISAQLFPILDIEILDLNNDGFDDVMLAGNIYNTEVETPRLDAGSGVALINQSGKSFQPGACPEFCFHFNGNIKDMELINLNQQQLLLGIPNSGSLQIHQIE